MRKIHLLYVLIIVFSTSILIVQSKPVKSLLNKTNKYSVGCIIWDDGWIYDYTESYPLMQELGVVASTAVITGTIENSNSYYMTTPQIKELVNAGWGVLSHTVNHANLAECTDEQLDYQLGTSKSVLEAIIGKRINYIVYPENRYSKNSLNKAREYYKGGFALYKPSDASVNGINELPINQYAIYRIAIDSPLDKIKPLIDKCVSEKGFLVFMGHGKAFSKEFEREKDIINCKDNVRKNIKYCLDKGVVFKNVDDAMDIVGDKIAIGDEQTGAEYFFLSKTGTIRISNDIKKILVVLIIVVLIWGVIRISKRYNK